MTEIRSKKNGESRYDTNQSVRKSIDCRLEKIAQLNAHNKVSPGYEDPEEVSKKVRELELEIRDLDYPFYLRIVPNVQIPLHLLKSLSKTAKGAEKEEVNFILSAYEQGEV